jgi:hypothetical protein
VTGSPLKRAQSLTISQKSFAPSATRKQLSVINQGIFGKTKPFQNLNTSSEEILQLNESMGILYQVNRDENSLYFVIFSFLPSGNGAKVLNEISC